MVATGTPAPTRITGSGGGMASTAWRQILADVLGVEIATPNTTEGAAYGAGVLAAVGAGWFPTVEDACAQMVSSVVAASPGPESVAYGDRYAIYRGLYPTLADTFQRIAESANAAT